MSTAPLSKLRDTLHSIALSDAPVDCTGAGPLDVDAVFLLYGAGLVGGAPSPRGSVYDLLGVRATVPGIEALTRWTDLLEERTLKAQALKAASTFGWLLVGSAMTLLVQWVSALF